MTKYEVLKKIANVSTETVTQKQVDAVLTALEVVVKEAVLNDDDVTIPGICKVKSKLVPEKTGIVRLGANKGGKWIKPEHKEATVKIVPALKKIFG